MRESRPNSPVHAKDARPVTSARSYARSSVTPTLSLTRMIHTPDEAMDWPPCESSVRSGMYIVTRPANVVFKLL